MTDTNNPNPSQSELEPTTIQVEYAQDGVALLSIISEPLGILRFEVKRALSAELANARTITLD